MNLLTMLQLQPALSARENQLVSIEILKLDHRLNIPEGGASGLLTVRFTNQQRSPATILFSCLCLETSRPKDATKLVRNPHRIQCISTGDMARLDYQWTNAKGTSVLNGGSDICNSDIQLGALASVPLFAPIKIPSAPGSYNLALKFDNKRLKPLAKTHSDIGHALTNVFFQAQTSTPIDIFPIDK